MIDPVDIRNKVRYETGRATRYLQRFGVNPRLHLDALALQALAPLSTTYLPWTEMSMRPSGLVTLLNDIVINNRKRIVECGGGISTLYMAQLLSRRGGHLHTVEEDPEWSRVLGAMVDGQGLADHVSIIVAPMAPTPLALDGNEWYSQDDLEPLLRSPPIDLLVVDGPQATERRTRMARYPAMPFFAPNLSDDCTIVLDDIGRRGEQEVVQRWEREHGRSFSRRFFRGGIAVSTPEGLSV